MSIIKRVAAGAALTAAVAVFAAGCGETVDSANLESQIQNDMAQDAGVDPAYVSVDCPEDQSADKGTKFECELTAPNGDVVTVNVEITGEDGQFRAEVPPQRG